MLTLTTLFSIGQNKPFDVVLCENDTCVLFPSNALKYANKMIAERNILIHEVDSLYILISGCLKTVENYEQLTAYNQQQKEMMLNQIQNYHRMYEQERKKVRLWKFISGGVGVLVVVALIF